MNIKYIRDLIYRLLDENGIHRDRLYASGDIYYRNGNDGTEFDYACNNMTCEFMCFYISNDYGAIKLNQRGDELVVYLYAENDPLNVLAEYREKSPFDLTELCDALYNEFDKNNRFDCPIIDWDIPEGLGELYEEPEEYDDEYEY